MELAERGYMRLIEKIGAKKIIQELRDAEQEIENAKRKAKAFFKTSHTSRSYKSSLKYEFTSGTDKDITASKCEEQCRTWRKIMLNEK